MKVNGIELKGIDTVIKESHDIGGYWDPRYLQVNLDTKTGEVWTNLLSDFGCNSVVRYHDKNVINCGSLDRPADEWYVRYLIERALEEEM